MSGKNISIIGIGNIGITLATLLAYRTQWNNECIKKLTLVDPDLLEEKNIPYGFQNDKYKRFLGYPKVFAAEEILHNINENLNITIIKDKFPNCISDIEKSIIVDCRDTPDKDSRCFIKICSDGPYSKIVFNPTNDSVEKKSNYIIGPSRYHSILTVSKVIEILFYEEYEYEFLDGVERTYIIDFINNKGDLYEFNSIK